MQRTLLLSLAMTGALCVHAFADDTDSDANEARRSRVFARVGDATITVGELEDRLNARSPYARNRFTEPDVLKTFADDQVQNELFYQGAAKLGYADDPRVGRFLDQTIVQLFVRKEFEEATSPDEIPLESVAKYYQDNPEQFRRPEMRRARHILLASKKEAEKVLKIVQSDGTTTFRTQAKERSLDTETKMRGGDLLYFNEAGEPVGKRDGGAVDTRLAKAAFGLEKPGDFSPPLDLGGGHWSVLELTGIRPEMVQSLEQAAPLIRRKLWRADREAALENLLSDLRAELKPEVHPERMDAIALEGPDQPVEHPKR